MSVFNADAGDKRRDDWGTPDWLFRWCSVVWGPFELDVAASVENRKCDSYHDAKQDGLLQPWAASNWGNPPFSLVREFTGRAVMMAQQRRDSVLVLPSSTSARWFHENVFEAAAELVFLNGRVPFVLDGKESQKNNAGTVLAYYTRRGLGLSGPMIWTALTQAIKRGALPTPNPARQTGILDR